MENSTLLINDGVMKDSSGLSTVIIIQIIIFISIFVIGIIGNSLVIYVVIHFSKMQTVTNMYIVNLAVADECFLLGVPILITTMIYNEFIFGPVACKIYYISTSVNQFTSSILVLIISIDRYIAVCHSVSSPRWRTPFISKALSALAWICSILLMTPIIQHANLIRNGDRWSCQINWSNSNNSDIAFNASYFNSTMADTGPEQIYTIYLCITAFIIPFSCILVFYFLIIRKLLKVGSVKKSKGKEKSSRKVTRLVMIVIAVYLLCGLPFWLNQMVIELGEWAHTREFFLFAYCLNYANPALNPIIYTFLSDNFRKSFTKAFTCLTVQEVNATLQEDKSIFPAKKLSDIKLMPPNHTISACLEESDADSSGYRRNSAQTNSNSTNNLGAELLSGDKDFQSSDNVVESVNLKDP